ncbi:hypothetical protein ACFW04_012933 [Cataglyphis niger]
MSNFNRNLPYELLIRSNTIISNLGKYEAILKVYIKTNFAIHDNKLNKHIDYGSVTDGILKLEVHIINFMTDDYLKHNIVTSDSQALARVSGSRTLNKSESMIQSYS